MGRYTHPINKHIINVTFEFLNCCFYYFALSVSAPFSGGHLNPAVSLGLHLFRKNKYLGKEILGQFIGAMLGATVGIPFLT
jgi:glycerol uptake facilitator-like aquaporin